MLGRGGFCLLGPPPGLAGAADLAWPNDIDRAPDLAGAPYDTSIAGTPKRGGMIRRYMTNHIV